MATKLEIDGTKFLINGEFTYLGRFYAGDESDGYVLVELYNTDEIQIRDNGNLLGDPQT